MNWLTKLMYGRYGTDRLGLFMLIVVLLLDIIFTFTGWDVLYILAFVLACYLRLEDFFAQHQPALCGKPEIHAVDRSPSSARSPLKFPV